MPKAYTRAQPTGTIAPYAGNSAPAGYLLCNGSILSRAAFPKLFSAIGTFYGHGNNDGLTFHLPDTRGIFLRGVDGTKGNDPDKVNRVAGNAGGNSGNNVGSLQLDEAKPHTHSTAHAMWQGDQTAYHGGGSYAGHVYRKSDNAGLMAAGGNWGNIDAQNNAGTESRPKNINVNFIIKL